MLRPDFEQAMRRRRANENEATGLVATVTPISGFVSLDGPGQALFDVPFPLIYTEKPTLQPGYELDAGQVLDPTNFPTLSLGVHFYTFKEPQPGVRHYTGARLIIVATGHANMKMIVHYRFEGVALVNPTSSLTGDF